jgi:transketolase
MDSRKHKTRPDSNCSCGQEHGAGMRLKSRIFAKRQGEAEKEIVRPFQHETLCLLGSGQAQKGISTLANKTPPLSQFDMFEV